MFTLAEFIMVSPASVTSEKQVTLTIVLALATQSCIDTERIVSISCRVTQGGQGKNILFHCRQRCCQNNIAILNDPLCRSPYNVILKYSGLTCKNDTSLNFLLRGRKLAKYYIYEQRQSLLLKYCTVRLSEAVFLVVCDPSMNEE